eukprot:TRINITY_DN104524_c0_g1_i1.p1 TRINITY_DN104524_c0_g1~~TRINITY_DN104524_c0_g1_i1.p1  ORF type:complete len:681 (+),score=89.85 TRINITY_DN104524_c0_g1_i1:130-2172(+)
MFLWLGMSATQAITMRLVMLAADFPYETLASSVPVNLDSLTGRQYFAYDSFRPFCYSVIIGATIRQDTSSSRATCNDAGFGTLGAILNLGSYNATASTSRTQGYDRGETCGTQGQSVSTTLEVFSDSSSAGITATLTQPTACQYSLSLAGPVAMFSTTTVSSTSSSTLSTTSTASDTFTPTTTSTISSLTFTTFTKSTATTTSVTLSSFTSSSRTITFTRITSTSATRTSLTRTTLTHTSSTETSATSSFTVTTSTTTFICTTPMQNASCPACQESSIVLPMVLVFFAGVSLPITLQGGTWLCKHGRSESKVSPGLELKDQNMQTDTLQPVFDSVTLIEPEPVPEPAAEILEVAGTADADLLLDVEHVLIFVYPTLKSIFQYYSFSGARMSKQQLSALLEDCQLANIPKQRVEAVFDLCSASGRAAVGNLRVAKSQEAELEGMLMVSEHSGQARFRAYLGISEFVNAILHFAWQRADRAEKQRAREGGPRDVRTALGKAFRIFVEDELKPLAGQADNCMSLRNSLKQAPAKGTLAKSHISGVLGQAFKYHADARSGLMSLKNFDRWTRRAGLLKNDRLSSAKLRECFIWAADKDRGGVPADWRTTDSLNENTQVFVGPDCSQDAALTEIEFTLAFARIAHIMFSKSNDITPANLAVAISQLCNQLEKDAAYPEDTRAMRD